MATFAPVYRPGDGQRSHLHRQQQRERKRRRLHADFDPSADDTKQSHPRQSPDAPSRSTSISHPVHRKDPYHVAGHAREQDLPAPPFPHARFRTAQPSLLSIDEQLASLRPPLILPGAPPRSQTTSLKRMHAGNLTTILHRCMLRGDWDRASRAWGLLLRTEIAGEGPAVRKHGHWTVGAELLMRRHHEEDPSVRDHDAVISEKGLKLARECYERLILQFPHTPRSQHAVNALSIYPAMFNVWVFEIQDRSRRARQRLESGRPSTSGSGESEASITSTDANERLTEIRRAELEGATKIVARLDEVMTGPPYDTSPLLLKLRGMSGLWVADLNEQLLNLSNLDDSLDLKCQSDSIYEARTKARVILMRVRSDGHDLPTSLNAFVDEEEP